MVVVGAGRIGTALALRAEGAGEPCTLIGRGSAGREALDGPAGEPVILAVRSGDLAPLLDLAEGPERIPPHRRPDLVFVQNGAVLDLLRARGLEGCTRGVLYVMVARQGDRGEPGATSWLCGPHAQQVVSWLGRLGLPAAAVGPEAYAAHEIEKLLWLAVFGPLCDGHGTDSHRAPVGAIAESHADEVTALVDELAPVAAHGLGADPDALDHRRMVAGMLAYSRAIPDYVASVKDWPWRNGWLRERAREAGLPTPLHDALLTRLGHPN
jgi:ketopantoate reductase